MLKILKSLTVLVVVWGATTSEGCPWRRRVLRTDNGAPGFCKSEFLEVEAENSRVSLPYWHDRKKVYVAPPLQISEAYSDHYIYGGRSHALLDIEARPRQIEWKRELQKRYPYHEIVDYTQKVTFEIDQNFLSPEKLMMVSSSRVLAKFVGVGSTVLDQALGSSKKEWQLVLRAVTPIDCVEEDGVRPKHVAYLSLSNLDNIRRLKTFDPHFRTNLSEDDLAELAVLASQLPDEPSDDSYETVRRILGFAANAMPEKFWKRVGDFTEGPLNRSLFLDQLAKDNASLRYSFLYQLDNRNMKVWLPFEIESLYPFARLVLVHLNRRIFEGMTVHKFGRVNSEKDQRTLLQRLAFFEAPDPKTGNFPPEVAMSSLGLGEYQGKAFNLGPTLLSLLAHEEKPKNVLAEINGQTKLFSGETAMLREDPQLLLQRRPEINKGIEK